MTSFNIADLLKLANMVVEVTRCKLEKLLQLREARLLVQVEQEHDGETLLGGEYPPFLEGIQRFNPVLRHCQTTISGSLSHLFPVIEV